MSELQEKQKELQARIESHSKTAEAGQENARKLLADLKQRETELRTAKDKLDGMASERTTMNKQIKVQTTASDELKRGLDAKTRALEACQDMLSKTHQVLATCKELHAKNESPLAPALAETCQKVQEFLKTI